MKVLRVRQVSPSSLRDSVAPKLGSLLLTATMDPRGRVSALTPKEALPAPGGDAIFSRFTAPLPADAVGDGATWERLEPWELTLPRIQQPVQLGIRTRYRLAFVLVRGEPRKAKISAELRFHLVRQGKSPARVTGAGKGSAEFELDLLRGEAGASKSELELDLEVSAAGRRQRLTQRLATSTRPIKSPAGPRPSGRTRPPRRVRSRQLAP
jgi:hypothetical protein